MEGLALPPLEMVVVSTNFVLTAKIMTFVMMIMTSAIIMTSVFEAVSTFEDLRHPSQELL